jgi:hypothetical protein
MNRIIPRTLLEGRHLTTPQPVLHQLKFPEDIAWSRDTHKITVETRLQMTQTRLAEDLMEVQR